MVFEPTTKLRGNDGLPEVTETKEPLPTFTSTTAPGVLTVGVTVIPSLALEME